VSKLRLKLLEKEIMIKKLADKCGVTSYIMGQKIKYNDRLKLPEIKIILDELNTTFEDVFLNDEIEEPNKFQL
jgi:hypothetical protein